uniref:Uncharacterized protein n=1 Tax=Nelumbo nucifera TaxID=4432 RepID=A0A822XYL1_NELNU|nr:TPA_asm: hypothetical protein HUJ06_026851 [Nelumbo nucifera]
MDAHIQLSSALPVVPQSENVSHISFYRVGRWKTKTFFKTENSKAESFEW